MSKVYGIHEIELIPGVDEESFIKFFNQSFTGVDGWTWRLLKGERGQRAGKYAVLVEIESVEARDRWSPTSGGSSEERLRWLEEHKEEQENFAKAWASFSPTDMLLHPEYTDYLELE